MKSVPERSDVRRAEDFLNQVKSWLEDTDVSAVVVVHCVSGVSRSPVPAKRKPFQIDGGPRRTSGQQPIFPRSIPPETGCPDVLGSQAMCC